MRHVKHGPIRRGVPAHRGREHLNPTMKIPRRGPRGSARKWSGARQRPPGVAVTRKALFSEPGPDGGKADRSGVDVAGGLGHDQAARGGRRTASLDVLSHVPGTTAHLSNGGTLEHAQQIAGHASPKATKLYDRTADTVTVDEILVTVPRGKNQPRRARRRTYRSWRAASARAISAVRRPKHVVTKGSTPVLIAGGSPAPSAASGTPYISLSGSNHMDASWLGDIWARVSEVGSYIAGGSAVAVALTGGGARLRAPSNIHYQRERAVLHGQASPDATLD